MKTKNIIGLILLALIVIAVVWTLIHGSYNQNPINNYNTGTQNNATSNNSSNSASNNNSNTGNPQTHDIQISMYSFSPSSLTINAGDTVIWTNMDSVSHTVTSDSGNELGSQPIANGQTYSHTFTIPGTYTYHCSIHPLMHGTIIVQ